MKLSFKKITICTAAAAGLLTTVQSNAQLVLSGSGPGMGGSGPIAAQVTFTLSGDQLTIQLEDTLGQGLTQWNAGQLISGISFNVDGSTGADLNSGTGNTTSFAVKNGDNTYTPTGPTDITSSWAVQNTSVSGGANVNLTDLLGGKPQFLIIGPDSIGGFAGGTNSGAGEYNINGSVQEHEPVVLGTATFILTVTNITSLSQIDTNTVVINFGTSPGENTLTPGPVPVPESATILSGALMLVPLSVQLIRKGWKRSQPKTD